MLSATLLVGCGDSGDSGADEVRIAEPVLDFPQTSTTATPAPEPAEDEESSTEETTTEEAEEETTTTSSTTSSTTRSSTTRTATRSRSSNSGRSNREPAPAAPAPAPQRDSQPSQSGATCAWPTQNARTGDQEYSTFCDRQWARTVTPADGQDFYWIAQGTGWATVDPAGSTDEGPCWHRDDFADAPDAIKGAVKYCPGT